MRSVVPFADLDALLCVLDKGGYFFDPTSAGGDGVLTVGELMVPAQSTRRSLLTLYLSLISSQLSDGEQLQLRAALSERLARWLHLGEAKVFSPAGFGRPLLNEAVMVDGRLAKGSKADELMPFWVKNGKERSSIKAFRTASALGYEYSVARLWAEDPAKRDSILVLGRPGAPLPHWETARVAGFVRRVEHDDGRLIRYLEPHFGWNRKLPTRRLPHQDRMGTAGLLAEVLRHVPPRPGDD